MSLSPLTVLGPVAVCTLATSFALAGDVPNARTSTVPVAPLVLAQQVTPPATAALPVYTPPRRGTPSAEHRVGGGTRAGKRFPTVTVLVPEHTGLTISEQPALYWFLTEPLDAPLEIIITDANAVAPLLEFRLLPPTAAGIQRIRLADHNVHLSPGVQYEWSIALVVDSAHRSRDVFASGSIERVESSPAIQTQLDQASTLERPNHYAAAGLWYDALGSVSDLIEKNPKNQELRKQRASLLEQVGLKEASAFDRS
jgi:hypothetical protein